MGYVCLVCDALQRDETHLMNHLALQAIVHDDDHETWLGEHAPEWVDLDADLLGSLCFLYTSLSPRDYREE